jgi:hypothetical protein
MKTYSDLQAIDTRLHLQLELILIGQPTALVMINDNQIDCSTSNESLIIDNFLPLMDTINIDIILSNKQFWLTQNAQFVILVL